MTRWYEKPWGWRVSQRANQRMEEYWSEVNRPNREKAEQAERQRKADLELEAQKAYNDALERGKTAEQCSNCRFFLQYANEVQGQCRRNAVISLPTGYRDDRQWTWPPVQMWNWCGEHRRKP